MLSPRQYAPTAGRASAIADRRAADRVGSSDAASLALGSFVDPLVGAVIGAFVWEISTEDPDRRRPLREAASDARSRRPTTSPRVLVIANRTLHGEALRAELRRRAVTGAELHIVAPIVCSRAHYIASDIDTELDEARSRVSTLPQTAAQ